MVRFNLSIRFRQVFRTYQHFVGYLKMKHISVVYSTQCSRTGTVKFPGWVRIWVKIRVRWWIRIYIKVTPSARLGFGLMLTVVLVLGF